MSAFAGAEPWAIAACVAALLAGGFVKGVTSVGLPLVAVPVLSIVIPLPQALVLVTLPSIVSSVWQCVQGTRQRAALSRLGFLLAGLVAGMTTSVQALASVDKAKLDLVLGVIVATFSVVLHRRIVFSIAPRHEWWTGALTGLVAGLIGGVSLFVGPIFAMYLSSLRLDRNLFVTAMAIANLSAAVLFAVLVASVGIAGSDAFALSAGATVVAILGLWLGQSLRQRINEEVFRKSLAVVLFIIGMNLVWKALG